MLYRFLLICSFFLLSSILKAQYTVKQIDSICSSIDSGRNSSCKIACGHTTSRKNCYLVTNEEILLSSSGFIYTRDTSFQYNYYYLNNKPIKTTLSLESPVNNKIYSAVYYFNNDKAIKVIGENLNLSDPTFALSCAYAHTYWFPKVSTIKEKNK
jgi:hypothetical protein